MFTEMKDYSGTGTDGHFHRYSFDEDTGETMHEVFVNSELVSLLIKGESNDYREQH